MVGGILSDAAETVLAGAGILKNAVGVFGMLAVLRMCVAPFLQLGIHYLTYKVTSALSATVSSGRVAGSLTRSAALRLVLGMTGASALLLLIVLPVIFDAQSDAHTVVMRLMQAYFIFTVMRFVNALLRALFRIAATRAEWQNNRSRGCGRRPRASSRSSASS